MSSNYPTSIQTFSNPTSTDFLENATAALDHDYQHTTENDTLFALQTKCGVDGSLVNTTFDYKLSAISGGQKALTSGSSTQSVTGLTLVTPVINIGSDSTGDMYYRNSSGAFVRLPIGTAGQILNVTGGVPAWIANPSASDASTTIKGVVEIATTAEINAGTATGGTGAPLAITPDQLAASNYLNTASFITNYGATLTAAEAITAGQPVSAYYYQSDGGVTFDNKTTNNSSVTSSGGVVSYSFTVGSGSNRALVLFINVGSASGTVPTPTVTYNSVSMTLSDTQTVSSSQKLFTFTLLNPASGANTLAITLSASAQTNYVSSAAMSYANVSAFSTVTGAATNSVSYGVPGLGVLLVSGTGQNIGTSSVNNNNNYQTGGLNSFAVISSADSGIAHTASSATVTYGGAGLICVVGLTPFTSPTYGYVVKSSSATPANGVNLNKYTTFLGFAKSTVSAGQSLNVTTSGIATGLSSLTPLLTYYLNDTAGTIGTTAGTNSKKVGLSLSTTSLALKDSI